MDTSLNNQLTAEDIAARAQDEVSKKLNLQLPSGLASALAEEEILIEKNQHLRRVKEHIFKRDILPAISGKLGNVSMAWWIKQFGSPTVGFFVVEDQNESNILFEFPPMGPNNAAELNSGRRPIGDVVADYSNRLRVNGGAATEEFKSTLRQYLNIGSQVEIISSIAKTERIMRHYGETILSEAKPELVEIINAAIEGLDAALGPLSQVKPDQTKTPETVKEKNDVYDDDGEASPNSFD